MNSSSPVNPKRARVGAFFPAYRTRVHRMLTELLSPLGPIGHALDFGSGDGWFSAALAQDGGVAQITPVDVVRRPETFAEPLLYDGRRLPFEDQTFDLVFAIDSVHHTPDPALALGEMLRCSARYVLLKDHTYRGPLGWLTLVVLDELGNRRFGIPSPGLYQHRWEWGAIIEEAGFERVLEVHPAPCHSGLLGWLTNPLQFMGLWRRKPSS